MSRSWAVTTLAVATMSLALAILGAFAVVATQLRALADQVGADVAVSVYVEPQIAEPDGRAMARAIGRWSEVSQADFWTSAESMAAFREDLGEDAVILEGLPDGVIPPSVEIVVASEVRSADDVRALAARLRDQPRVTDVRYGEARLERLQLLCRLVEGSFIVLGAALVLATLMIVANTVRLTVLARSEEIEVLRLVGATRAFIGAPFLLEGILQGIVAGALAWCWLALLGGVLRTGLERMLRLTYAGIAPDLPLGPWMGPLVLAGLALGFMGSALAVGRFTRGVSL